MPLTPESRALQTAEEIAKVLNVTARTVYLWAESGRIPTAYRSCRTIRFDLEHVLASLNVDTSKDGRGVELVVLALSLAIGPGFPRIPKVDLDSITLGELEEIKRLVAAYLTDLNTLATPQECAAYAEGVLEAARTVARMGNSAAGAPGGRATGR